MHNAPRVLAVTLPKMRKQCSLKPKKTWSALCHPIDSKWKETGRDIGVSEKRFHLPFAPHFLSVPAIRASLRQHGELFESRDGSSQAVIRKSTKMATSFFYFKSPALSKSMASWVQIDARKWIFEMYYVCTDISRSGMKLRLYCHFYRLICFLPDVHLVVHSHF